MTKAVLGSVAAILFSTAAALAAPQVGAPAPDFVGTDSNGNTVALSELKGERVILEWYNHDCPYVRKHYDTSNMQNTQTAAAEAGYTWLQVISSRPGAQGYVEPAQANELIAKEGSVIEAKILDPSGDIGRAYDAKTTPHMYIIDSDGTLLYMGGIDDKPSARKSDIEGAKNYVLAAMADIDAGNAVQDAVTRPYGCSVKY